ncbi:hypothetical protein P170DRAFT_370843, partial [Aspergillus steynii IBT 23096]
IPPGIPGGAMCVQRLDDSLNSAIHINYRISLRSSSMPEPRDPLLKVLTDCDTIDSDDKTSDSVHVGVSGGRSPGGKPSPAAAWTAGPPKQLGTVYKGGRLGPEGTLTQ